MAKTLTDVRQGSIIVLLLSCFIHFFFLGVSLFNTLMSYKFLILQDSNLANDANECIISVGDKTRKMFSLI